jgi:hypothetical protein
MRHVVIPRLQREGEGDGTRGGGGGGGRRRGECGCGTYRIGLVLINIVSKEKQINK